MKYIVETRTGNSVTRKVVERDSDWGSYPSNGMDYANNIDYYLKTYPSIDMLPELKVDGISKSILKSRRKNKKRTGEREPTDAELKSIEKNGI